MSREGSEVAGSLRCSSALPSAVEGRGGAARRLASVTRGATSGVTLAEVRTEEYCR